MLSQKNTIKNFSNTIDASEGTCQKIYNHYAKLYLVACEPEALRLLGIDDIATERCGFVKI
ncbi:MAG: transposase [Candidatus Petromonas sp.]|jgi:hypothetical protein|nr:transposase [Candidatus Petromonas sp.]